MELKTPLKGIFRFSFINWRDAPQEFLTVAVLVRWFGPRQTECFHTCSVFYL